MKLVIEESFENSGTEITIRCGQVDENLKRLIEQIRLFSFSIMGRKNGAEHLLLLQDILYIESVDKNTFLYTDSDVFESTLRIYEFEQQLENCGFVRTSKACIINIVKLESVRSLINGKFEAVLTNGEKLIVNRHYVPEFKKSFGI